MRDAACSSASQPLPVTGGAHAPPPIASGGRMPQLAEAAGGVGALEQTAGIRSSASRSGYATSTEEDANGINTDEAKSLASLLPPAVLRTPMPTCEGRDEERPAQLVDEARDEDFFASIEEPAQPKEDVEGQLQGQSALCPLARLRDGLSISLQTARPRPSSSLSLSSRSPSESPLLSPRQLLLRDALKPALVPLRASEVYYKDSDSDGDNLEYGEGSGSGLHEPKPWRHPPPLLPHRLSHRIALRESRQSRDTMLEPLVELPQQKAASAVSHSVSGAASASMVAAARAESDAALSTAASTRGEPSELSTAETLPEQEAAFTAGGADIVGTTSPRGSGLLWFITTSVWGPTAPSGTAAPYRQGHSVADVTIESVGPSSAANAA